MSTLPLPRTVHFQVETPGGPRTAMRVPRWFVLAALLWVSSVRMVHAGDNVWTSLGPEGGSVTALAIDPLTPTTLYAGTYGTVFQSTDGGRSWRAVTTGLTSISVTTLAIDPLTPTTLYAGTGSIVEFPFPGTVFQSTDGGSSWRAVTTGLPNTAVHALAIDSTTPTTLYAGPVGRGVFTTFILPQFPLVVSKGGTGSGTVTSTPAGISCGSTCSAAFDQNTSVTLTATAASGSTFAGWSGEGCSGTSTCTVSMTQARSITATFALLPQSLTVTLAGTGSGTVTSDLTGISCPSACEAAFPHGQSVTLSATAASGSTFAGWDGEGCGGTDTCTVSMTQARSVTATFNVQQAQGGGGGCTLHPGAGFDPVLIGMVGLLVCLTWRRRGQGQPEGRDAARRWKPHGGWRAMSHWKHSVMLPFPVAVVGTAQTPDPTCRYTWHSVALTCGCCSPHTTTPLSASSARDR